MAKKSSPHAHEMVAYLEVMKLPLSSLLGRDWKPSRCAESLQADGSQSDREHNAEMVFLAGYLKVHSPKLTVKAPENRPHPKRK